MRIAETIDEEITCKFDYKISAYFQVGARIIGVHQLCLVSAFEVQTLYFNIDCQFKRLSLYHRNIMIKDKLFDDGPNCLTGHILQLKLDPDWIT